MKESDKKHIHIGILGTRGIPNRYGGFEQFATILSENLVCKGADVSVYCSHYHPVKEQNWHGVQRIRVFDPESFLGNAGQIIYDLLCILDARHRNFDVILQLGYTSNGLWQWLLPRKSCVISNMDGLEWSRAKYNWLAKKFLVWSEKNVADRSDFLIADALPIQAYLDKKFKKQARWLAYSAEPVINPGEAALQQYGLQSGAFNLVIARLQPDNHIEEVITGHLMSNLTIPLIIVGSTRSTFGSQLKKKYSSKKIVFLEGIFDKNILDQFRYHAHIYFHGHSAGGTNPSLLEAMAAQACIIAHKNEFNESILGSRAGYFSNPQDICDLLNKPESVTSRQIKKNANLDMVRKQYSTAILVSAYHEYIFECLHHFQQTRNKS